MQIDKSKETDPLFISTLESMKLAYTNHDEEVKPFVTVVPKVLVHFTRDLYFNSGIPGQKLKNPKEAWYMATIISTIDQWSNWSQKSGGPSEIFLTYRHWYDEFGIGKKTVIGAEHFMQTLQCLDTRYDVDNTKFYRFNSNKMNAILNQYIYYKTFLSAFSHDGKVLHSGDHWEVMKQTAFEYHNELLESYPWFWNFARDREAVIAANNEWFASEKTLPSAPQSRPPLLHSADPLLHSADPLLHRADPLCSTEQTLCSTEQTPSAPQSRPSAPQSRPSAPQSRPSAPQSRHIINNKNSDKKTDKKTDNNDSIRIVSSKEETICPEEPSLQSGSRVDQDDAIASLDHPGATRRILDLEERNLLKEGNNMATIDNTSNVSTLVETQYESSVEIQNSNSGESDIDDIAAQRRSEGSISSSKPFAKGKGLKPPTTAQNGSGSRSRHKLSPDEIKMLEIVEHWNNLPELPDTSEYLGKKLTRHGYDLSGYANSVVKSIVERLVLIHKGKFYDTFPNVAVYNDGVEISQDNEGLEIEDIKYVLDVYREYFDYGKGVEDKSKLSTNLLEFLGCYEVKRRGKEPRFENRSWFWEIYQRGPEVPELINYAWYREVVKAKYMPLLHRMQSILSEKGSPGMEPKLLPILAKLYYQYEKSYKRTALLYDKSADWAALMSSFQTFAFEFMEYVAGMSFDTLYPGHFDPDKKLFKSFVEEAITKRHIYLFPTKSFAELVARERAKDLYHPHEVLRDENGHQVWYSEADQMRIQREKLIPWWEI